MTELDDTKIDDIESRTDDLEAKTDDLGSLISLLLNMFGQVL